MDLPNGYMRVLIIYAAISLLPACSGPSFPGTVPVTSARTDVLRINSHLTSAASSGDLLYVSQQGHEDAVGFYSYPKGKKVGILSGFGIPGGLCVDSKSNIFVTNVVASGASTIIEYAHGRTTPIKTLNDPGMEPSGCAIDPTTGDLAVANRCHLTANGCEKSGNILVYPKATGSPRKYRAPLQFWSCTFDAHGTLYADGFGHGSTNRSFELVKLPSGSADLQKVNVHFTSSGSGIVDPGGIQWDGKYLAINYPQPQSRYDPPSVYRVDPSNGRVVSVLKMQHSHSVFQTFINHGTLIAPNIQKNLRGQVLFYTYPNGRKLNDFINGLELPVAVVVSAGTRG